MIDKYNVVNVINEGIVEVLHCYGNCSETDVFQKINQKLLLSLDNFLLFVHIATPSFLYLGHAIENLFLAHFPIRELSTHSLPAHAHVLLVWHQPTGEVVYPILPSLTTSTHLTLFFRFFFSLKYFVLSFYLSFLLLNSPICKIKRKDPKMY